MIELQNEVCGCGGVRSPELAVTAVRQSASCFNPEPELNADLSDGYCQTKAAAYFKGNTGTQTGSGTDKLIIALFNPEHSGVNVFINKVFHANLTNVPLKVVTYLCTRPVTPLTEVHNVVCTNTYDCRREPNAEIRVGKNVALHDPDSDFVFTVTAFDTFQATLGGSVLLAPGQYYIAEVTALEADKTFKDACSFAWWEEKVQYCC